MPMPEQPTRTRWRIIGLVFLIYVLMYIDRVNISIAATYIMPEYGLSDVQFGWIFSAFVLGYALAQIPGGWLGDRYGPRRVMTWAIVWWSVFTAATAVAGELALTAVTGVVGSFAIVRILIGLGEAAAPPNGNRIVANWVPLRERAFALGIAISGSALGAALTPPLIVWIMVMWGWREAFYISGAAGVLVALLWYWLGSNDPSEHQGVNAAELAYITADGASVPTADGKFADLPWRRLFGRLDICLLTVAYAVLGYIAYFYFAWFYLYLVNERGFSMASGGIYTMAPFLTSAAAGPLGGWLSDRLCERYGKRVGRSGLGFVCMLLTGTLLALGATADNAVVTVALMSASNGALFLCVSAFWATTIDLARDYAGTASGFMNMGGNLGGTISPSLTPWIAQSHGWGSAILVMAGLSIVAAFCWLAIDPDRTIETG